MANPYEDGLDDFDRDLLGHAPLGTQPFTIASRRYTHDHFPTPTRSGLSTASDTHGTYYEVTLLPSPHLRQEPLRQATMAENGQHAPVAINVLRHEVADPFREPPVARQAVAYPLRSASYERTSQTIRSNTSSLQNPGSSSPTTRVSSRKQQRGPISKNAISEYLVSLPSNLPTPASQAETRPSSSTPVVHGIPLVSLRQVLPDKFRAIFPYELLNAVQSKCFDVVYNTNDNLVVAAPTGSGKTAILELAICRLALDRGNENFKIVYQAPTKALCSEKARDWEKKFSHMNLKCAELTGDTSQAEMRRVGDASIIVTTPEKWDSITRKWQDHKRLLQMVELFLIDEVHILKDARGATLEAVVSRMKTIGANVRFIALSATVPNSDDIARWLGRNHTNQQLPAHRESFGEEFRPVKLQKFVYGFENQGNDFTFDRFLDQKLPGLISRHARQKPILVFCFTRKSCELTAAVLADFASGRPEGDRLWPIPSQRVPVVNRDLQEYVMYGVAFHHAGLDAQDRVAIEQHFLNGQLGVICCTSTLAAGINLPCHTVVLKGTVGFSEDRLEEYSDLEVMQMLGRAGRPQFDDSATAIILTRAANKERYQKMVSGQEILESTLHLNLIEHLNSEICLGTIHDLTSAKAWLAGTFLSVRLRRNPDYYQLTGGLPNPSQVDGKLEEICERDITQLQEAELVANQDAFQCTEYGRAMSKYMIEFQTMKLLLQIPRGAGMESLITILSQASEFKEFRFKPAERALFREINQSPLILYPVKEAVTQTRHKISLMVQTHLGCVQYPDSGDAAKVRRQLMVEKKLVFERLNRLVRAVIDCKGYDRDAVGVKIALELARALAAGSWEGRPTQLTQVPNIGPVGMRKLASKDIRTVIQLADKDYDEIERLMSRQPPFGKQLQAHLDRFPRLSVEAAVVRHRVQPNSEEPVLVEVKATLRYLNRKGPPNWLNRFPALTFLAETQTGNLVYFWRGNIKKLDRESGFELGFTVGLRTPKDRVVCHFTCEEIVGTIVSTTLEHKLPSSIFPSRPISSMIQCRPPATASVPGRNTKAKDYEYLDEDGLDDSDLILAAEQALTHPATEQLPAATAEYDTGDFPSVEELIEMDDMEEEAADGLDDHFAGHHGDETHPTSATMREPVRLPNGRWQCNHACSGGAPTKSGKPCSHRCCKEGLDKPRKRPLQRPKRKREEPNDAPAATKSSAPVSARPSQGAGQPSAQAKRQNVQTTLSLASLTSNLFNNAVKPLSTARKPEDFDLANSEWIDLSLTDDEADDILMSLCETGASKSSSSAPKKPSVNGVGLAGETKHNGRFQTSALSPQKQSPESEKSAPDPPKKDDDHKYDFLDDDVFSVFEGTGPCQSQNTGLGTNAFKSGASDLVLYQGIKFAETGATSPMHCHDGNEVKAPGGETDTPGLFLLAGDAPGMSPDTSPQSSGSTGPAQTPEADAKTAVPTTETSSNGQAAKDGEPAWVAEFDPEFVDMFRGYVTFV